MKITSHSEANNMNNPNDLTTPNVLPKTTIELITTQPTAPANSRSNSIDADNSAFSGELNDLCNEFDFNGAPSNTYKIVNISIFKKPPSSTPTDPIFTLDELYYLDPLKPSLVHNVQNKF